MAKTTFLLIVTFFVIACTCQSSYQPPCDNDIFCHGEILHTVQTSYLFEDSKTFVDMKMKIKPDSIKEKFKAMMDSSNNKPSKNSIKKFVDDCFSPPGSEFTKFVPEDWKEAPKFLNQIEDQSLKVWAKYLHNLWKSLGRKMTEDVFKEQELYSIIYVAHPVIVPGGRFREFYYWDSYWIMVGLLHSEMDKTVKGMLENFIEIIKVYGFIPNGGRIYYNRRSQPPLIIPMVKLYYDYTKDLDFVTKHVDVLSKELEFWLNNRSVEVTVGDKTLKLVHYAEQTSGPRPESYREDIESAKRISTEKEKNEFYSEIKSACESGWDFSTRWFLNQGTNKGNLTNIRTKSIIPVDLNSYICWNANLLHFFYNLTGNTKSATQYKKIAKQWKESIHTLLWSEEDGIWYDYDKQSKSRRRYFYASNFAPLWTGCFDKSNSKAIANKVLKYFEDVKVNQFAGGIPTSLENSGEQWDYPNAWPPLQHIIIEGMENLGTKESKQKAFDLAFQWIRANYRGYVENKGMYEKYDAQVIGGYGGGGEYTVQIGFGWTNGVCLDLLKKYGTKLDSTGISGADKIRYFSIVWRILIATIIYILSQNNT